METMSGGAARAQRQRRGMLMMLAAVGMFALMDAGLKTLSAHYPPLQVAAMRGLSSLPVVLAWALWTVGPMPLLRVRWPLHLLRGALGIAMMASFVYALKRLPLSTAYSIFFVAPLLITALSVPILGERVGPRRWTAIAVGLLGVLVVLRPTGAGVLSTAGLAVLVAAVAYAVSAITVRIIARSDTTQAITFWLLALMALGAGALALPDWVPLRIQHGWIIGGIGIAGALGQYTITEAFRLGEASLIAPLGYVEMVGAILAGWWFFNEFPDSVTIIGTLVLICCALMTIWQGRTK